MKDQHIVTSFNADMNQIDDLVLRMGGLVEKQLQNSTEALRKEDRALAKSVLRGDDRINELEAEINEIAIKILALRRPVAIDLRNVVVSLKIARHLERIGDYAKNTARRTNAITKADAFIGSVGTVVRMSELVQNMIKQVLDAYSRRDIDAAELVRASDADVDQMNNTLFRELLTYMIEDTRNISGSMHLLFVAKNLERMGDHIADIAKETLYMISGKWPDSQREKRDKTSKMIIEPDDI